MNLSAGQLAAFVAVIREGSFDAAAKRLHVTPPAISQRIKQLEEQFGAVLVVRSSPCVPTATGAAVYRHALQVELLERDLIRTVAPRVDDPQQPAIVLPIAVNADSLATWLVPALQRFCATTRVRVDLCVDDEADTTQWLRSGKVLGAVTSSAHSVLGCIVRPLGRMRYRATASARFVRKWLPKGSTLAALQEAPCLSYNRKDRLCERFLHQCLELEVVDLQPHFLPSPHAYLDATLTGLGWGLNPEPLAAPHLARRRLIDLAPGQSVDVPLYWQQWSIASTTITDLAAALCEHAAASLEPL